MAGKAQAVTNHTHQANSPKKIHPSPLLGGRLGGGVGGHERPRRSYAPQSPLPSFPPLSPSLRSPLPSFLRRQEPAPPLVIPAPPSPVIPAQAGTNQHAPSKLPQENSSLPPFRGRLGGGWEATSVRGDRTRPGRLSRHSHPSRHPCAPPSSFLRRQEPAPPPPSLRPPIVIPAQAGTCAPTAIPAPPSSVIPAQAGTNQHAPSKLPQENSSLPPFRGEVRWGVGSHERPRRSYAPRSPLPSFPPHSVIPAQAGMRARRLRSQPQATGGAAAQRWRAVGMLAAQEWRRGRCALRRLATRRERIAGGRSVRRTPHLASPLKSLLQNAQFRRIRRSGSIWSAPACMRRIRHFAGDS